MSIMIIFKLAVILDIQKIANLPVGQEIDSEGIPVIF